jgi:hypothetical protein
MQTCAAVCSVAILAARKEVNTMNNEEKELLVEAVDLGDMEVMEEVITPACGCGCGLGC